MKKKIILILGMVIMVFLLLNIEIGKPYLITGDRERDANCLGYSKEVRDEINSAGGKATLIIFRNDKEQGHCLVLVNYKTDDWKIIESYTGEEFTDIPKLWEHLTYVLVKSPNFVSIKEDAVWSKWVNV